MEQSKAWGNSKINMDNEILDDLRGAIKSKHANRSVRRLLFGLGCYVLAFAIAFQFTSSFSDSEVIAGLVFMMAFVGYLINWSGLYSGMKSIQKNEPQQLKKVIGFVGNFLIVAIGTLFLYVNLRDIIMTLR